MSQPTTLEAAELKAKTRQLVRELGPDAAYLEAEGIVKTRGFQMTRRSFAQNQSAIFGSGSNETTTSSPPDEKGGEEYEVDPRRAPGAGVRRGPKPGFKRRKRQSQIEAEPTPWDSPAQQIPQLSPRPSIAAPRTVSEPLRRVRIVLIEASETSPWQIATFLAAFLGDQASAPAA